MRRRFGVSSAFLAFCLVLLASWAAAQWISGGVPVCTVEDDQYFTKAVTDGAGGAIVVWQDWRKGSETDIYGNRVGADGNVLGPAEGVPVCTASGYQYNFDVVYDGAGGVILAWSDERTGYRHIYVQRVDTTGVPLWGVDGKDLCPGGGSADNCNIIADGYGGAIVVWSEIRNMKCEIFSQRLDVDGNLLWDPDGVRAANYPGEKYVPVIASDGSGGAVIAWWDDRNSDSDIFAQRIGADGSLLWDTVGVAVCTAVNYQRFARIAADGGGGAYIVWPELRNGITCEVYAQRIDQDGLAVWEVDGINVCPTDWHKYGPQAVEDGSGGVIVVWSSEDDGYYQVFAQRIDPDGNSEWAPYGSQVFPVGGEGDLVAASDGLGGVIVGLDAYYDENLPTDIYAQRLDHDGNRLWGSKGAAVCTAPDHQFGPSLVPDGTGGALVAWEDYRIDGDEADIFCQRVDASGLWGDPAPGIVSVLDVPEDQGGWVRIRTRGSSHDAAGAIDGAILGYNVWRMIGLGRSPIAAARGDVRGSAAPLAELIALLSDPRTAAGVRVDASRAALLGLPEGDWESVGFWFATRDTLYGIAVPTRNDSTEAGTPYETFIVTAHSTEAGIFAASEPAEGYSVDNLAPGLTAGFEGYEVASPHGLDLSWSPNPATDLWKYSIYRGDDEFFVPDESNLIGSTDATELFDAEWLSELLYCYKLVAVDRHGNLSPAALLKPEDIHVGTELQSFAASLSGPAIELSWILSEVDEAASFVVWRAQGAGEFDLLSQVRIARDGNSFSAIDGTCEPGTTYRYRVVVDDASGSRTLFETDAISTPAMPLTLRQNCPNPFNPATLIGYYLPEEAEATLDIYDASGRLVSRLLDGARQPRGEHSVEWRGLDSSGRSAASGVYFYRLTCERETISKKMVLLR